MKFKTIHQNDNKEEVEASSANETEDARRASSVDNSDKLQSENENFETTSVRIFN